MDHIEYSLKIDRTGILCYTITYSGVALYPGEAMLALLVACQTTGEPKFLESVMKAFPFYRNMYYNEGIDANEIIFFANWQSQAFSQLHRMISDNSVKEQIRKYLFALQDRFECRQPHD